MFRPTRPLLYPIAMTLLLAIPAAAQDNTGANATPAQSAEAADLLTQAELETLVAPAALYPDTLLIQILVASTFPMEVVKADRLLTAMEGEDEDAIKAAVEAEGYDPSVEVLATAFPTVISDMAQHIEWTEAMGDAMLAQSDDVMTAVQTMRQQAIDSGALISGNEQTVSVANDEVVITPTNPEKVYVPQYQPAQVYDNSNTLGNALAAGALTFGTIALIDEIFDDDDDWNDYWGCRNCGGWGGRPIINDPHIDLDRDGDVIINGRKVDRNDFDNIRDKGWHPDKNRQDRARDKITKHRDGSGKTKLPVNKTGGRGDELRGKLTQKTGATDISRPGVNRPSARPDAAKRDAIAKTAKNHGAKPGAAKAKAKAKAGTGGGAAKAKAQAARKPAVKKQAAAKAAKRPAVAQRAGGHSAIKQRAPAQRAHAASHRGGGRHQAGGGRGGGRAGRR